MLKILGYKSFLGKNFCKYLDKNNIKYKKISLKNKNSKKDIIINFSGHIKKNDDIKLIKKNILNIIKLVKNNSCKIVHLSTIDVYKKQITKYSATKYLGQKIIEKYKNHLIMIVPYIFGYGDKHDKIIPNLIKIYLKNKKKNFILKKKTYPLLNIEKFNKILLDSCKNETGVKKINYKKVSSLQIQKYLKEIIKKDKKIKTVYKKLAQKINSL